MTKHKWHKEIKAWADGAEIERKIPGCNWVKAKNINWDMGGIEYRIKPQPKEPQYLYVFMTEYGIELAKAGQLTRVKSSNAKYEYIGQIKLEVDDD